MQVLSGLTAPAYLPTPVWVACRSAALVKLGMRCGTSGASALAYGYLGTSRPGLSSIQRWLSLRQARVRPDREARLHRLAGEDLPPDGTRLPLDPAACRKAIEFMRETSRTAIETGDPGRRLLQFDTTDSGLHSCGTIRLTRFGASLKSRWT